MGALGDVLPDAAKKLYRDPGFSREKEGIRAFDKRAEGSWRTIEASWVKQGLAPLRPGRGLALLGSGFTFINRILSHPQQRVHPGLLSKGCPGR
jgi:hypothetical protein